MTVTVEALPVDKIKLPPGFAIEIYADKVKNARQMALSPSGVLYVGTRSEGKVYAIQNKKTYVIAKRLDLPVGVVFHDGDLYVSAVSKILKFKNIESNLLSPPQPEIIYDKLPEETHHGWKYLAIGPDKKLYFAVGAPCNICLKEQKDYAAIHRINLDGSGHEIIAHGVRNTVGFTWHPTTHKLWFTDNGRDWMGDDRPPCELNVLDRVGEHFGYPYCHGGTIQDDEFNQKKCAEFKAPVQNLGPHVAPLGIKFYTGKMFPEKYHNRVFIAEHGSWNRSKKIGYRITMVELQGSKAVRYEPFAIGWLNEDSGEVLGRPVDLLVMPDGSMLVSDDEADVIYRISYKMPKS